jgi:hypothetical protein
MVAGLDIFKKHFRPYAENYVLIGGTACELAMEEAGLPFRATKDLDIVLCIEALDESFVEAFWDFIKAGKYKVQQKATGGNHFYRFKEPETGGYPVMLELFSRKPDMLQLADDSHLTPIPIDEEVASLSAILLDDEYYHYLQSGKKNADGLSYIGAEHLIPLKARAWLELTKRKARGGSVDSRDIKKHKNDVFRLYQILNPDFDSDEIPIKVKDDLEEFASLMEKEEIDFRSLGLRSMDLKSVLKGIRRIYALG